MSEVPWNRYKDDTGADGELPEELVVEAEEVEEEAEKRTGNEGGVTVKMRQQRPKDFLIRKEDAEKHGYTRGCGGCSSWFKGLGRQWHTEKCRERFRELMKEDARVKNNEAKRKKFDEKVDEKLLKKLQEFQSMR